METPNKQDFTNGLRDGRDAAAKALDKTIAACHDVKESGGRFLDSAKHEARVLGDSLHKTVDNTLSAVGNGISTAGSVMRERGSVGEEVDATVEAVALKVEATGHYLTRGITMIGKDISELAQKHPLTTAAVGIGVGLLISRGRGSASGAAKGKTNAC